MQNEEVFLEEVFLEDLKHIIHCFGVDTKFGLPDFVLARHAYAAIKSLSREVIALEKERSEVEAVTPCQ